MSSYKPYRFRFEVDKNRLKPFCIARLCLFLLVLYHHAIIPIDEFRRYVEESILWDWVYISQSFPTFIEHYSVDEISLDASCSSNDFWPYYQVSRVNIWILWTTCFHVQELPKSRSIIPIDSISFLPHPHVNDCASVRGIVFHFFHQS